MPYCLRRQRISYCGVLLVIALTKTKKSLEQKEYKCSIYKGFGGGGRVGAAFGEKCEKTQKSAQNLRAFAFLLHWSDYFFAITVR